MRWIRGHASARAGALCLSTLASPGWGVDETIKRACEYGYQALELRLLDGEVINPINDRRKVIQAVQSARSAGIEICMLSTSCQMNQPSAGRRAKALGELRLWLDLASTADIHAIRVFGGADRAGRPLEAGTESAAETLAAIAGEATSAGVTVALETHDAFSTAERTAQVLHAVPSDAIGAVWDCFHTFVSGESPEQAVHLLRERIAHVHIKDGIQLE